MADEEFDWHDYLSDDEDDMKEFEKVKPTLNEDLSMYVVVDGLPVVGKEKYDKLFEVVKKFFGRFNAPDFKGDVWMPLSGEPAKTKGLVFYLVVPTVG